MTRIILIRHGETDYNTKKRYSGFSDISLNAKGKLQAKSLAERLKAEKIDAVYSSDLKRALQTARIIFRGRRIKKRPSFREMNFGIFEGLKHDALIKKYPRLYKTWLSNPAKIKVPAGEALSDLKSRAMKGLFSIMRKRPDETIAIVSHGGTIRVILAAIMGYGLNKFWEIDQDSCCVNIIEYRNGKRAKLVVENDTRHL